MIEALIRRDWKLHKEALLLLGVIVVLMMPVSFFNLPLTEEKFLIALLGRIAFGLGCLMPFLVHTRERLQGTFGDLLALPIARLDLVWLRWVEALVVGGLFLLLATLPGLHHFNLRELAAPHLSCTLPWIFLWVFAVQLPFQLRFGQKGGIAFGVTLVLLEAWALGNIPPQDLAKESALFQRCVHCIQVPHRAWATLGGASPYVETLLAGLLIWAAFRFALLAAEHCDV